MLRFHYHKLDILGKRLDELNAPLKEFQSEMMYAVSYTHLDVYKRQELLTQNLFQSEYSSCGCGESISITPVEISVI